MDSKRLKSLALPFLKKWWGSLLLLPFIIYSIHQAYWTLRFNIFFSVTYEYPFPLNFVNFMLDNFLLITHEAGHTFFSILGVRTITILGGSLFQIILPLMILAYTWINQKIKGTQFTLYLLGFSFIDVAFYAADGGARQLPLIGGLPKESHDWYNLLAKWDMLESDFTVGLWLTIIGVLCYLVAIILPLLYRRYETVNIEMEL